MFCSGAKKGSDANMQEQSAPTEQQSQVPQVSANPATDRKEGPPLSADPGLSIGNVDLGLTAKQQEDEEVATTMPLIVAPAIDNETHPDTPPW